MRLEVNLLLAIATGFALALLVMTAGVYGRPDYLVRYAVIAVGFSASYVLLNTIIERRSAAPPKPMLPEDLIGIPWAATIPLFILTSAAVPILLPGRDFALLVIVATVLFGLTVRSAMRVRRA